MGKQRRQRLKLHTASKSNESKLSNASELNLSETSPLNFNTSDNPFANITIDFGTLRRTLADDECTVKSFKSLKSEKGAEKPLKRKDKLKLRREHLMQKIDTVIQKKKEAKLRNKRKKTVIVGDINPLYDALPSLDSLLKKSDVKTVNVVKPKGVHKATKRRKNMLDGVQMYKIILNNKDFKKNPLDAISQHVKAFVENQ